MCTLKRGGKNVVRIKKNIESLPKRVNNEKMKY